MIVFFTFILYRRKSFMSDTKHSWSKIVFIKYSWNKVVFVILWFDVLFLHQSACILQILNVLIIFILRLIDKMLGLIDKLLLKVLLWVIILLLSLSLLRLITLFIDYVELTWNRVTGLYESASFPFDSFLLDEFDSANNIR
mgnify:FL=1